MQHFLKLLLTAAISTTLYGQTPALTSVQSPASNIPAALPNGGIAQGSIFVIYGKNLGPATIVQPSALPLPTSLGGTSVTITVNGTTVTAPLVYSLNIVVAAVLPSNTPTGTGTLTLTYSGGSGSIPITVVPTNFGISTVNESGTGPGVITTPQYALITAARSAKPGDTVVVWGTGLGPVQGSDAAAPVPADLGTPIQLFIGGRQAIVTYRGRSGAPGLDQINVQIPAGLNGCFIPVVVQTGVTVSNFTTIAVSPGGGACSDADTSTTPTSQFFNNGKSTITLGTLALNQTTVSTPAIGSLPAKNTSTSGGSGLFYKFSQQQLSQGGNLSGNPSLGGCLVSQYVYNASAPPPTTNVAGTGLNVGPVIAVTGPTSFTMPALTGYPGIYVGASQTGLTAGQYTFSNGSGGPDAAAFTVPITVATPLTWTNQSGLVNVPRTQPLTVTWSGGAPSQYVSILGTAFTLKDPIAVASFICTAPVSAGQFTIPTAVLLSLPAGTSISGIPTGSLSVGSYTATIASVAPFDFFFTTSGSTSTALVNYQ